MAFLSRLARQRGVEIIVECRRCGTTVDGRTPACPTCGGTGFAEYRIPR